MGYTQRFTCEACGLDRVEHVGVGMLGTERHLCSCPSDGLVVVSVEDVFHSRPGWVRDPALPGLLPVRCVELAAGAPCPCGEGAIRIGLVALWD